MAKRYIDAEAVEEMLHALEAQYREYGNDDAAKACIYADIRLETVPAADVVERKRGEWIYKQIALRKYSVTCPFCGLEYTDNYDGYVDVGSFNFCPNCGADMREDGHDD